MEDKSATPITKLEHELATKHKVSLFIKREDLIHQEISGNKWWKLKHNIEFALSTNKKYVLTYGGAYSNHILATAAAGHENGLKTIGVIRGEKVTPLNPTLAKASLQYDMQLYFVSRAEYRDKNASMILDQLKIPVSETYVIPEGGSNSLAVEGCKEIINGIPESTDYICCSCGTGGTLAGLICGSRDDSFVLGFSALKGDFLTEAVQKLIPSTNNVSKNRWEINTNYHFGGYARFNQVLISFINDFKKRYQIGLDPIYTGKMMYGIFDLIGKSYFPQNSEIVAIHTGGIQGILGFNERHGGILD